MSKRRCFAVVVATIVAGSFGTTTAALACDPGRPQQYGHWFDGWRKYPPSGVCNTGMIASIRVYEPHQELNGASMAWVMIANEVAGTYGQIGWTTYPRHNFTQSNTAGGAFQVRFLNPSPIGSTQTYKVTYGGGVFQYFINGVLVDSDSTPGFGGCVAQNFGEIQDYGNQMPGGYADHELFSGVQYRRSDTGSWSYISPGTPYTSDPFYWGYAINGNSIEIWDQSCAS